MLAILGGGVAGLAAAVEAEERGLDYVLFEAGVELGGNARTFEVDGFRFDAGAHRLHDRIPSVTARMRAWLGHRVHEVSAPSRIRHGRRFVDFPLEPRNLLRALSPGESVRALGGLVAASLRRGGEPANFAELVRSRYGRPIADPFLVRYSEKLWGEAAERLSVEVAGRRLDGIRLRGLLRRSVRTSHMEGRFLYPERGIGDLPRAMARRCSPDRLLTGARVVRIERTGCRARAVALQDGRRFPVDHVLSTLPIAAHSSLLRPALGEAELRAARALRWRGVVLVALFLDRERVSPYVSTYFPSPEFSFTRVHEPRARSAAMVPAGATSLVAEIPCAHGDSVWSEDDDRLVERTLEGLERARLVVPGELIGRAVRRLPHAYPVLSVEAAEHMRRLRAVHGRIENVDLVGRAATFRYLHLHDLVASATAAVQRLAGASDPEPMEVAS